MQKLPIGIQDFKVLRTGGYLYVDKTSYIYDLIESGKYYFLSRPRRFGKSLLLSTLKYLFLGEKQLFDGLWISDHRTQWNTHPVVHLSFSALDYKSLGLEAALDQAMNICAGEYGITLIRLGLAARFQELLQGLGKKNQKVILLIDEYDKPLVDYIDQVEQAEKNRAILKNFFSAIKDSDAYLHFFLITGVSKFSKVSLFSDLNHLRDITLVRQYNELAGYTKEELAQYFGEEIKELALSNHISEEEMKAQIRHWYNGYRWKGEESLYNPFSILNFFASGEFANYWWETGTPSFLIKQLRKGFHYDLNIVEAGSDVFESYTLDNLEWRSLLFQTGYLTIHNYDPELYLYTLGYPNREVKDAMHRHMLGAFRNSTTAESQPLYANIKRALDQGNMTRLIELINTLFASIPHQIFLEKYEAFFHAILHLTFQGLGLITQSEVSRSKGRLDTVVHSKAHIYVMEFKLDDTAEAALDQIREKRYGSAELGGQKEVIAMGIGFSSETKAVNSWKAIPYLELLAEE